MAHGVSEVLGEGSAVKMVHQTTTKQQPVQQQQQQQPNTKKSVGVMGSRRIFAPAFKLKVLDSYRNDIDCRGNQRATARKYGIHRRQIQKWLQCEENLRSSCAEATGNNAGVVTSGTSSSSSSSSGIVVASKPEETLPAESATPATAAAAAPALNLSLGRLHGDELAARQGLPPPPRPRPSRRGSPSSPHYVPQATILPLYQEYPVPSQEHCLRTEYEERVRVPEVPCYRETPEGSYYVLGGGDNHRDGTSYAGRNEAKVYQSLGNAYEASSEMMVGTAVDQSPTHHHRNYRSSQGDVVSSVDGKTYGLLLAPSMIKTERASPDSAATPGPYESALSPGAARAPPAMSSDPANSNSTSVHFESPRSSPGAHVHVHEHQHRRTGTPDSEKPQEGENATSERREEANLKIEGSIVKEETTITSYVVKLEEAEEPEDVTKDEEENVDVGSSSRDYQRPPVTSSVASPQPTGPTSPLLNDRETLGSVYSLPSSPRGPNSSGRSSSSCSDSEMDALDCLTGSHNSAGDLTRRRSFSLRFKLDVLDAFHRDSAVAGNQRATARKFGINRRQVQKWLGQETELRGEIALRGNSRQRLGPIQDSSAASGGESPVDLRTTTTTTGGYGIQDHGDMDYERSPRPVGYCCDVGSTSSSSSSQLAYYPRHPADLSPDMETRTCTMSCCVDYQEPRTGLCYAEPPALSYCYSPRDSHQDSISVHELTSERTSPLKRSHCTLACCYDYATSPKRLCLEAEEPARRNPSVQDSPPQETPLCLVKPKRSCELEPVSSTVPTPPASAAPAPPVQTSKKDAILFKPYLDNPVSKPKDQNRGPSPNNGPNAYIKNNNNNCQSICNLNENRGHDFALELSLRVPISWRTHQSPYTDFPQVRSAFVRYPASPHYT